ncbi:proline dehydrogenase family protein [Elizabethkingia sp. JS20170427COW]|uniref:proline dehydrogenase family protein n=1 Tax=Elizabethkingia sp. JS20170427COW TaxID=2583851 RepID=UPI00111037CF|nr:proline dehydrogenase family protein [Elizabethkingia sp. JS20170427COW]QCX52315.1 proline dehydrogenase [Elizabethkingia sp. JS20170427COW]
MSIFENTEIAFADRSTQQLNKAYWMFKSIENPALTNVGISILNFTIKNNFPFVKGIVKSTLFEQFCGGETREESIAVVNKMWKSHVGSIFDYAIEGKADEKTFDEVYHEILDIIKFSKGKEAIPFVVFKPTAFGRIEIFEKVGKKEQLSADETAEWQRVVDRFDGVCKLCHEYKIKLMIDAEDYCMQDAADDLADEMMEKYNKDFPIVWNTMQMYRTGRIEYMEAHLKRAREKGYVIGYKIVRGAYMEKERERAAQMGYPSPIQPTKQASDDNYNAAVEFVMQHPDIISAFFGSHNETSMELIMNKMKAAGLPNNTPHVFFGQLYGMSDNITYYLAKQGYNVAKYLPYGPVKDVVPYLTRRAQENTSVAGQTGRELALIARELKRRKK